MSVSTGDRTKMLESVLRTNTPGSAWHDEESHSYALEELHWRNHELQERVEELGTFASTITHQLKDSDGALTHFSVVLQDESVPLLIEQRQACLEYLAYTVDKLNTAMNELVLSYAKAMWC